MNNRNKRKGMEISGSERSDQRERERDRENFLQASSHRTPYPPFKTTMAASILFFGGIILLISGFVVYFKSSPGGDTGISLLACGSIMFIPGSYASYILFGAWMGWPDFHYDMVPSYDD